MAQSLIRKNQLHPDIADLVHQYGSGYFVPMNSTIAVVLSSGVSGIVNVTQSQYNTITPISGVLYIII